MSQAAKPPENLGQISIATQVVINRATIRRPGAVILLLAASVALMMTGFGIVMPVFARRLGELGGGVQALGLMTVAFAASQFIASPFMGALADRWGRRPLILTALGTFVLVNIAYLFAPSVLAFILIRGAGGAFTAGLFPAAMGVVADIVPEKERARWIGIVMGGYGVGFIFGPALGGFLYDAWGFAAPFIVSAALALAAFLAAAILIPETRPRAVRRRDALRNQREKAIKSKIKEPIWASLPKPFYIFAALLFLDFIGSFAFAFVEPEMIFYFYDDLGWTTAQFGVIVGAYGLAMVLGQTLLGQSSDRFGRKPVIIAGIALSVTLYVGLTFVTFFWLMAAGAMIAGLGSALLSPALSAFYLDITAEAHRSRVVGMKESALALGGVLGPLAVVAISPLTTSQGIFVIAGALTVLGALLAAFLLKEPHHIVLRKESIAWEVSKRRSLAAESALQGIILRARRSQRMQQRQVSG